MPLCSEEALLPTSIMYSLLTFAIVQCKQCVGNDLFSSTPSTDKTAEFRSTIKTSSCDIKRTSHQFTVLTTGRLQSNSRCVFMGTGRWLKSALSVFGSVLPAALKCSPERFFLLFYFFYFFFLCVWNFRSREYKRADEQWMLHPSSINLVSLPLLLLSLYMKVIMTPSSIILLSLLFSWNCLIICYRFVFTHIILPVICSISSCKHTAHFHWPFFEDYCQWHLQDAFGIWSIISVAMGNYTDLSVIAKSTTSNSVLMQR